MRGDVLFVGPVDTVSVIKIMRKLKLKAAAKINLYLDVLFKRDDGYHQIESVVQSVSLYDVLCFEKIKRGIQIISSPPDIIKREDNLIYRAAQFFFQLTNLDPGIKITLKKNIPIAAGLGGGSTDAAATLVGLNYLFATRISISQLMSYSLKLGTDIPFCIRGGTAILRGKGDEVHPLPSIKEGCIVLIYPGIPVSTSWAYSQVNSRLTDKNLDAKLDVDLLKKRIISGQLLGIQDLLYNKLEEVVIERFPLIGKIKNYIKRMGVRGVLMSGSGSTVFALVEDEKNGKTLARKLNGKGEIFIVKPTEKAVKED